MKLCFDTNAVIDIVGSSDDFFHSYAAYDIALTMEFDTCISITSLPDIVYLLKQRGYLNSRDARDSLDRLFLMFEILDAKYTDSKVAFESEMGDFEDALISFIAQRHEVDFIITRNKRDFIKSPVPALSPEEFVGIFKPAGVEYEMASL